MASISKSISIDRLKEELRYEPDTGLFFWKKSGQGRGSIEKPAGGKDRKGYTLICVDYKRLLAHRIAWAMTYGEWPATQIDHRDCDKSNNRIDNLRLSSDSLNRQNMRRARIDSTSGLIGALKYGGKKRPWTSRIKVDGKYVQLGTFITAEEAHEAYIKAKRELHPGCMI